MQPEQEQIASRAVACRGWRWSPGMRAVGRRTLPTAWFRVEEVVSSLTGEWANALPDLTDPATLGCLLALVREAWGQDDMGASRYKEGWCVEFTPQEGQHHAFYGATEAEALVAALEAAP